MGMDHEKLVNGDAYTTDRGKLILRRPAPHVVVLIATGYGGKDLAAPILALRDMVVQQAGKIALFDDFEKATGYDSELRVKLTDWSRRNAKAMTSHHILTSSKLVAMGVAVANLALGATIKAHTSRRAFEEALRLEIDPRPFSRR
ncbi:MAG: hypothetical protein ABI551_10705 [Polyangiaceae bacterium]